MEAKEIIANFLKKNKIEWETHIHPPVFSVEESKKIKKNIKGVGTKCLFLKDEESRFYLVCLPGEKRLDTKKLRKFFGAKKMNFAKEQEIEKELRAAPGKVSLFGMIFSKRTTLVIDSELWNADITSYHPNENTETWEISRDGLRRFCYALGKEFKVIKL